VKQAEIVQTREVYETRRMVAYSEMGLVFVAVKCDRSLDAAVSRDHSAVDGPSRRWPGPSRRPGDGASAVHRGDGLVGGGESIKRSRDYRTSSRSNVTVSRGSGSDSAAVRTSTTAILRLSTTSWIAPHIPSPSICLSMIVTLFSV